jgi:hypothetical protein
MLVRTRDHQFVEAGFFYIEGIGRCFVCVHDENKWFRIQD